MRNQWIKHTVRLGYALGGILAVTVGWAQAPKITPQKDIIGFTIGDDYMMAS